MVTVLAEVLGAQVCHLILGLDVVNADFVLLHQLLYEKISQRNVHYAADYRCGCRRRAAPTCCQCTEARC